MKAAVLKGPKEISVIETENPKEDGDRVLIKVSHAGICGSDMNIWRAGTSVGLIMGHEFSGHVVSPGKRKDTLKEGDRVTVIPVNSCGVCQYCQSGQENLCSSLWANCPGISAPGGFAEYYSARPDVVRKLPDQVDNLEAAMIEPASVALHGVHLAEIQVGDKVLITGGGIVGLITARFARMSGASKIALVHGRKVVKSDDIDEYFSARDPELIAKLRESSGGGFDCALECAGSVPAVNAAIMTLKHGRKLVQVGIPHQPDPLLYNPLVLFEINIKGSLGYSREEFDACIDFIQRKKLDLKPFAEETCKLEDIQQAFEGLDKGDAPAVKVIVTP